VGSLAIGFVASILLARLLGPSDRGLLGLMVSVGEMTFLVVGFGIPVAVTFFASREERDVPALTGITLAIGALLAAVLVPLVFLFHQPIADALGRGRGGETWALAAVLVPTTFLTWSVVNQLYGRLRFELANVLTVASKVAYLVVVVVLLGAFELGVSAGLLATIAGAAVVVLGGLPFLLSVGRPRLDRVLARSLLGYGVRVQAGAIFQQANFRLDVVVLQFFEPLSAVGYYVVAQTIAELVVTLAMAFKTSVLPLVTHLEGDERRESTTATSVRNYGIVAGTATLANAAFGTVVILFAYGPEFHPAIVPMLVILPGIWFLGLGTVISGDLQGRGRPGLASALTGLAAAVTIALDFALIPPFGVVGAATASLIAYTALGIASLVALHRVSGVPLRDMLVPTRADLRRYRLALGRLTSRLRGSRSPG
jgi:O-antigen/teichoic acid export membrane protein